MESIIPYFGGKSRLAKTIIKKIPKHTCYVEVFAGGARVFFRRFNIDKILNCYCQKFQE